MMRRDEGRRRLPPGSEHDLSDLGRLNGGRGSSESSPFAPPIGDAIFGSTSLATEDFGEELLEPIWDSSPVDGRTFEESMLEAGIANPLALAEAYCQHYLLPLFDPSTDDPLPIDPAVARLLPASFCLDVLIAPLADDGTTLEIAIVSPEALGLKERIAAETKRVVRPLFAPLPVVERVLAYLYGTLAEPTRGESPLDVVKLGDSPTLSPRESTVPESSPSKTADAQVNLAANQPAEEGDYLRTLLQTSLRRRANEIHVETFGAYCRVRLRIDGSLVPLDSPGPGEFDKLVAQLKSLGGIPLLDQEVPCAGSFEIRHGRRCVRIDVDYYPTVAGAKVTLKPQGRDQIPRTLAELGMRDGDLAALHQLLEQPRGLLLVAGPNRSGKRSTLYAMLNALNTNSRALCTVEESVRRSIPGINQMRLAPERGLGIEAAVRASLRQHPDVLMIDLLQNSESVQACLRACRDKRLVMSAVVGTNLAETLSQMARWSGGTSLGDYLLGGVEQRILPRCCSECRQTQTISLKSLGNLGPLAESLEWQPDRQGQLQVFTSTGCTRCAGAGVIGEVGMYRVFTPPQIESDGLTQIGGSKYSTALAISILDAARKGLIRWSDLFRLE